MNYVITGSLGHVSKPIVEALIKANNAVTVITSKQENVAAIEAIGAKAAVGSVEDAAFLNKAFAGADAAYLMIPPNFNPKGEWKTYLMSVADNYVAAVKQHQIKHVVVLSSVGAHLRNGAGPVDGLGYLEEKLNELSDIHAVYLRPSYFYYNLFAQIGLLKQAGIFGANYGGKEKLILVDTNDIAAVAIKFLLSLNFTGKLVEYISTTEVTTDEVAKVLGEAVGKPNTPWVVFTDEQNLEGAIGAGLNKTIAEGYTEMGNSLRTGKMQEDYWKQGVQPTGNLRLADFAKQFAAAYHAS
jgi:uncharacterized protein YbjT (DUF2867 family)